MCKEPSRTIYSSLLFPPDSISGRLNSPSGRGSPPAELEEIPSPLREVTCRLGVRSSIGATHPVCDNGAALQIGRKPMWYECSRISQALRDQLAIISRETQRSFPRAVKPQRHDTTAQ